MLVAGFSSRHACRAQEGSGLKVCWWFRCRLLLPSTHENKLFAGSGERQRTAAVESPFVEAGQSTAQPARRGSHVEDMWLRAFSNKIAATVCVTSLSLDFHSVSVRNGFVHCWLVTLQGLKMTLCDPSATDLGALRFCSVASNLRRKVGISAERAFCYHAFCQVFSRYVANPDLSTKGTILSVGMKARELSLLGPGDSAISCSMTCQVSFKLYMDKKAPIQHSLAHKV